MGRNPVSHTLIIKALKMEFPHTLGWLLKTIGGVRRDAGRQNGEKVNQLSQKARCSSKAKKGNYPKKVPTNTQVWKKDGGRERTLMKSLLRGGDTPTQGPARKAKGHCPAYTCTGQNP